MDKGTIGLDKVEAFRVVEGRTATGFELSVKQSLDQGYRMLELPVRLQNGMWYVTMGRYAVTNSQSKANTICTMRVAPGCDCPRCQSEG